MVATTVRFSEKAVAAIEDASKQRGFASMSAFVRYAVEQELAGRRDELTGTEERLVGSIEQIRREQFRLMRMQQALFAYVDTYLCAGAANGREGPGCGNGEGTVRSIAEERRPRHGRRVEIGDARSGNACRRVMSESSGYVPGSLRSRGNGTNGSHGRQRSGLSRTSPAPAARQKSRCARAAEEVRRYRSTSGVRSA
jgi:Arc/MetJ-type ribon-helix-helix transcriptional regulator